MTDLVTMLVEDAVEDAVKDEKIEIAKNLLKEKVAVEIVSKTVGLDEATIKQLQTELNDK